GADQVGGQQVGGALDAREGDVERARQRPGERRLAHAGQVLDEHVALGDQRDEDVGEDLVLDLDGAPHVLGDAPDGVGGVVELGGRDVLGDAHRRATSARRATTSSRTAAATSPFEDSGTWRSPDAVTIVTSLVDTSKPASWRETSLRTTASSPLSRSLRRASSSGSPPGPEPACSAAKPTSVWQSRRSRARPWRMSG